MSHYISAEIEGKEIILTGGSSHRTIRAVRDSGFNIYRLFKALSLNGGMSGTGESKTVDNRIAENAYKHAIAWANALETSFPEQYKNKSEEYLEFRKDFPVYLNDHPFDVEELKEMSYEMQQYHYHLNKDQIKRSFHLLYSILYFTYHIYKHTKNGNELEIGFG
jgi:hypothetical protein